MFIYEQFNTILRKQPRDSEYALAQKEVPKLTSC